MCSDEMTLDKLVLCAHQQAGRLASVGHTSHTHMGTGHRPRQVRCMQPMASELPAVAGTGKVKSAQDMKRSPPLGTELHALRRIRMTALFPSAGNSTPPPHPPRSAETNAVIFLRPPALHQPSRRAHSSASLQRQQRVRLRLIDERTEKDAGGVGPTVAQFFLAVEG